MVEASCDGEQDGRNCCGCKKLNFDSVLSQEHVQLGKKTQTMCSCIYRGFINGLYSCRYTKLLHIFMIVLLLSNVKFSSANFYNDLYERMNHNDPNDYDNPDNSDESYDTDDDSVTACLRGEYLKGYTLEGGTKAGKYVNLGEVEAFDECAELCCQDDQCKIAIMLTSPKSFRITCFRIDCYDPKSDLCKVKSARHSKYHPHLFRRPESIEREHKKVATSEAAAHSIITNEVKSTCHDYTGSVCANAIDKTKLYFYTSSNDSALDKRLQGPINQISSRLSGACRNIALQAICYRFYPQCDDPSLPKPINVCENECDNLMYGECSADFAEANMLTYLQHVIPNCGVSDDEKKRRSLKSDACIKLDADVNAGAATKVGTENPINPNTVSALSTTLSPIVTVNTTISTTLSVIQSKAENSTLDHAIPEQPYHQTLNSTYTTQTIAPDIIDLNGTAQSDNNLITSNISAATTEVTHTINSMKPVTANANSPVIVNVNSTKDAETELEELDPAKSSSKAFTTTTSTTIAPTVDNHKPDDEIRVSAGDDTAIELPVTEVSLYASTWPKESFDGEYSYLWSQIDAPKDSHGYIEGKTSKNVKLTKLDVIGVYRFSLKVTSAMGKEGISYVNITVKKPARVNHPPRAEVSRSEQTIQLPTNTVILDGSKSSDDDKIVSYKWEELKGPIEQNTVFGSDTGSKILQLRNLIAGEYHFKLTATDSDGETDSVQSVVIVKAEQNYPPKANAGHDVIIRLPNNSVVLNGNQSSDDKGDLKYAWSKSADSPRCDIVGTDHVQLKISSLVEGTYVFTLRVTDTSGQSDEAQVKVIVVPEINTKPIAIAGDDKELKYPDTATTLDGSRSTDNSKIISYHWEKISGPQGIKMLGANEVKVHLSELEVGTYVVKLTVTDDKGLVGTDTVQVKLKREHNEPPQAIIEGRIRTIYLPTRHVVLDGSHSTDDEMVASYHWTRGGSSPAAGDVINGSDHSPILRVANLVKGKYLFDLTVTDEKGLTGVASAVVTVKEDLDKLQLVDMYLDIDIKKFTEESKKQLIRKISVVLEVDRKYVKIVEIEAVHYHKGVMVKFLVEDPNIPNRKFDGKYIADILKHKVGHGGKLFGFTMLRVEPYVCRNNCSNHGYCDDATKQCVCDTFWMSNFFKSQMGAKESNCDWSILYMSVAVFAIFLLFIGLTWSICYLLARKKRSRRRARYRALRNTDPDGADDEILLIPKAMKEKFSANSLTFTESDEDSEEESTIFDKNRVSNGRPNGHIKSNGSANGKLKYRDHAM